MQSKKLLIATTNPGKATEIREALAGLPLELVTLADYPELREISVEETGSTYAENALIKANFWLTKTGLPTLADDSGIIVDALRSELGISTRRWGAGEKATDAEWLDFFLERMKTVPSEKRTAEFVCVLALVGEISPNPSFAKRGELSSPLLRGDARGVSFTGSVKGIITESIEAPIKPGIPLSSVFRPQGSTKVFAAMTADEKNQFSHRGRALMKLRNFLKEE